MTPERYRVVFNRDGKFVLFMCFRPMKYHALRLLAVAERFKVYGDVYEHEISMQKIPVLEDKDVINPRCLGVIRVEEIR